MEIRNRTTGAVITEDEFRRSHAQTSFPPQINAGIIDDFGYDPVLEGPQPTLIPPYQYAQRDGVVEVNGQWFTHYIAAEPDDEGKAAMDAAQAKAVRDTRNSKLAECDWTQLPDAPVDAAAWATYRQELRDISAQAGFPWEIQWPAEPA